MTVNSDDAISYEGSRFREVVTPEGVPLRFEIAKAGDRIAALLIDLLLIGAATLVMVLGAFFLAPVFSSRDFIFALWFLLLFLLRTFYFIFFELAWRGQTPGKRWSRIRIIDARGSTISAEAIITRNLTRELELFLPLVALTSPSQFLNSPAWVSLVALLWAIIFGFLPLFNRDRQRVGDLIASTLVVRLPMAALLQDLTTEQTLSSRGPSITFEQKQLDAYGIYELQVLEQVLRDVDKPGYHAALATIAQKIRDKIGWDGLTPNDEAFLRAFYAALRGRLEQNLLFGKRRANKHDRSKAV